MINRPVNKLWSLFLRLVHVTLFFELISHALPPGLHWVVLLLQQALPVIETHAASISLAMGIVVSFAPEVWRILRKEPTPGPIDKPQGNSKRTKKRPRTNGGKN